MVTSNTDSIFNCPKSKSPSITYYVCSVYICPRLDLFWIKMEQNKRVRLCCFLLPHYTHSTHILILIITEVACLAYMHICRQSKLSGRSRVSHQEREWCDVTQPKPKLVGRRSLRTHLSRGDWKKSDTSAKRQIGTFTFHALSGGKWKACNRLCAYGLIFKFGSVGSTDLSGTGFVWGTTKEFYHHLIQWKS
jgi:hypothetical protein